MDERVRAVALAAAIPIDRMWAFLLSAEASEGAGHPVGETRPLVAFAVADGRAQAFQKVRIALSTNGWRNFVVRSSGHMDVGLSTVGEETIASLAKDAKRYGCAYAVYGQSDPEALHDVGATPMDRVH